MLVPTYPPSTEFWWEPKEPLQIAFWSMSIACLILLVLLVMCCILWRNAKRYGLEVIVRNFSPLTIYLKLHVKEKLHAG